MQKICCLFAISIGLGTLLGFNYSAAAEVLRVGGTGAATEMLKVLGEAYAAHSEHRLEVIPSLGSSGGIRALADGAIALSVSGRPLKPEESAKGLTVVATIQTPFVFVSSHRQLPSLNSAELPALYTNEKAAGPTEHPCASFYGRGKTAIPRRSTSSFPA